MKHLFQPTILVVFLLLAACGTTTKPEINIVPIPTETTIGNGFFTLNEETTICYTNEETRPVARFLKARLEQATGFHINSVESTEATANTILLTTGKIENPNKEAYRLNITSKTIEIEANEAVGVFYGMQSLLQLFPPEIFAATPHDLEWTTPAVEIKDSPRFAYRGQHLDVCRHFFTTEEVKSFIDLMSIYKLNIFHWHLTEDQGWRIEIKQYPKLTEVGAWRSGTLIGHYGDKPHQFDTITYGGFYTQEEIKEVVAYAAERYITIIPEIELPGHALAALASYPELGCGKESYDVAQEWGVFEDVYCPTPETFEFLNNVMDEVIALFPSHYIHIGGDECPKTAWENSPFCQQLIREKGLKNEHELQSYFIETVEKYLNSKGRDIVGWDEILEGGLAPNATVMSWRGSEGGIAAAKQKHNVIMSPNTHFYFDYYQNDPELEPTAIGGFLTLKKSYSYNPIDPSLTPEEANYIIGVQGALWTEYIPDYNHLTYMATPRMLAVAEVGWSVPENRDWTCFAERIKYQFKALEAQNINHGPLCYRITLGTQEKEGTIAVTMSCEIPNVQIRYSCDGTTPTPSSPLYTSPVTITKSTPIKARAFVDGEEKGAVAEKEVLVHKGLAKQVSYISEYNPKYDGGGAYALVDGVSGGASISDGTWQGFKTGSTELTIDLGEIVPISSITVRSIQSEGSWVFLPKEVTFSISSDGKNIAAESTCKNPHAVTETGTFDYTFQTTFDQVEARFITLKTVNLNQCPAGHKAAGFDSWTFFDEVVVE